jgi:Protein of unknown function (DUF1573)
MCSIISVIAPAVIWEWARPKEQPTHSAAIALVLLLLSSRGGGKHRWLWRAPWLVLACVSGSSCSERSTKSVVALYPHGRAAYQLCLEKDIPVDLNRFREPVQPLGKDSLDNCRTLLRRVGGDAHKAELPFAEFSRNPQPGVVLLTEGKPVVVRRTDDGFALIDYPKSPTHLSSSELEAIWPKAILILDSPPTVQDGPSKLKPKPRVHDFGNVDAGTIVERAFTVSNPTSNPVSITRVASSCGCTVADVKSPNIAPGGSADVTVTFNSSARSGFQSSYCVVHTTDGFLTLKLSGFVSVIPGFLPRQVNCDKITRGTVVDRIVSFRGPWDNGRQLVLWAEGTSPLSCRISAPRHADDESTTQQDVLVTCDSQGLNAGLYSGSVLVAYRQRIGIQHVRIPVTARVVDARVTRLLLAAQLRYDGSSATAELTIPQIAARDVTEFEASKIVGIKTTRSSDESRCLGIRVECQSDIEPPAELDVRVSTGEDASRKEYVLIIILSKE